MEKLTSVLAMEDQTSESISDEDFERIANSEPGNEIGYDCSECLNRGYFWRIRGDKRWTVPCKCMTIRRNLARIRKSSLGKMLDDYTFENFEVKEDWQKKAIEAARNFYKSKDGWMFMAGQPGSGKTHLCTALVGKMMYRGDDVRYMRWVEDGQRIKFGEFSERNKQIEELQTCQVLYIDDFLKTQENAKPDTRDVRLAFEILNMRYGNRLRTIISTEWFFKELRSMDEALSSRIYERSNGFQIQISRSSGRNRRFASD